MIVALKLPMTKINKIEFERKISALVTLIILLLIYLFLQMINVPETEIKEKRYDRIDWTKYHPKPIKKTSHPKNAISKEAKPEPIVTPHEVKKIDLTELRGKLDLFTQPTHTPFVTPDLDNKKMNPLHQMRMTINPYSDPTFLSCTPSSSFAPKDLPQAPGLSRFSYPRVQVKENSQEAIAIEAPQYIPIAEVPKVKKTNSKIQPIILIELPEDFKPIMPKIFVDLSKWMKNNPAELPEVVKKFMGFDSLDLASKIQCDLEGEIFDMFLVCKESIMEIRICLIHGNNASMLIDRGFKKKSHYLRFGDINLTDGEILSFATTREAPSDKKTRELYQIFLSWWQSIGKQQS